MNLEFLYYQEKQILDGSDSEMKKLNPLINRFDEFMATSPIQETIKIIVLSYIEKYAQDKYFATCFYDLNSSLERPKKPDYLDKYDFYMPKEEMIRKDIEHLILRIFKDDYEKTNARYLKELELAFSENQNLNNTIEEALNGKEFSKKTTNETTIYTIEESPIAEIEVRPKKFIMRTNPDKWKAYY